MRFIRFTLLFLVFSGCGRLSAGMFATYSGDGNITSETRSTVAYTALALEGAYDVVLTQGPQSEVRIETDKNLLAHVTTKVENGKLTLSTDGLLQPTKGIKIYVTNPNFSAVDLAGAGDISATTPITSDDLHLAITGSGDYKLEVHAKRLISLIAGAGDMSLSGTATGYTAKIEGTGDLKAMQLVVDTMQITVDGAGDANLNVTRRLDATVNGAGDVTYSGPVADVHSSINGTGSIDRAKN